MDEARRSNRRQPDLSVDTKKKKLIGRFKNPGTAWSQEPVDVQDHDFPSEAVGKAVPYGIYDVQANLGTVCVGTSRETPEFAVDSHKGHRYMTVVLDLETGQILHAHHGRDAGALVPFFWKLKRRGVRPWAVAMDMSEAYSNAVRMVFGDQVDIVHDPYHVVALANRAIDETRRDMVRELEGEERMSHIYGIHIRIRLK